MSLLGLVCRITQISNPGLRKEEKMHKHRRAGAQNIPGCTARSHGCFCFDTGEGSALGQRQKINKKLCRSILKFMWECGHFEI